MFHLGTFLRITVWETASQIALRKHSKEVRKEPGYIGFFVGKQTNKLIVKHQKITANHKNQTSQVNDFSAFLCVGRCKSLGLLKLFL